MEVTHMESREEIVYTPIKQACKIAGVDVKAAAKAIADGELPYFRINTRKLVKVEDVERVLGVHTGWVSMRSLLKQIGIPEVTFRNLIKGADLETRRVKGETYFRQPDIQKFVNDHMSDPITIK